MGDRKINSYKSYNWIVRTEEVANSPLSEGWCEFEPRFIGILHAGLYGITATVTALVRVGLRNPRGMQVRLLREHKINRVVV